MILCYLQQITTARLFMNNLSIIFDLSIRLSYYVEDSPLVTCQGWCTVIGHG